MATSIDLEKHLQRAAAGVSEAADKARVELATHIDNRLPACIEGDGDRLAGLLSALALWAVSGPPGLSGLAIWRDDETPDHPILIEALRSTENGGDARLPDAITGPAHAAGAVVSGPEALDGKRERLCLWLPKARAATMRRVGDHWGDAFRGKRLIALCDLVFDEARCRASLSAIGLEIRGSVDPDQALAWIAEEPRFDFILICRSLTGNRTEALRDRLASESPGSACLIFESHALQTEGPAGRGGPLDLVFAEILKTSGQARSPIDRNAQLEIPDLSGHSILIAEDVATNQSMLSAILAPTGARLLLAENGVEALRLYRGNPVDLVLMDIQMPQMDGLTATRRIHEIDPGARIIALTAYAQKRDQELYRRMGMQGYIAKPVHIDDLYAVLVEQLRGGDAEE